MPGVFKTESVQSAELLHVALKAACCNWLRWRYYENSPRRLECIRAVTEGVIALAFLEQSGKKHGIPFAVEFALEPPGAFALGWPAKGFFAGADENYFGVALRKRPVNWDLAAAPAVQIWDAVYHNGL